MRSQPRESSEGVGGLSSKLRQTPLDLDFFTERSLLDVNVGVLLYFWQQESTT